MQKILIVDDDKDLCFLLKRFLNRKGFDVEVRYSGLQAIECLEGLEPDVVISDLELGDIDGITILEKVKELYHNLPVIIITGHSDIKSSALALKQGAFDYLMKPLLPEQLVLTLQRALETKKRGLASTANYHFDDNELKQQYFWDDSNQSKKLLAQIQLVAPTNYNIIIYGDSGSGKQSLAHEIHKLSKRSHLPFIPLNTNGLAKKNIATVLFGYEGRNEDGVTIENKGILDQVNGGTLFISGPEQLPKELQDRFLAFLRQRAWVREGGVKKIEMDIRVFISSHIHLWNATRNGSFNEELYHRLNEFNIVISPLRERREEIPALANHFLLMNNENLGTGIRGITPEAMKVLQNHSWYDNVRELKNTIQKAALQCAGTYIGIECLPAEISLAEKLVPENGGS